MLPLFHWSKRRAPAHIHYTEEELTVGAYCGLGKSSESQPGKLVLNDKQGMQFFNFIFLARSWAADRVQLASQLASLGKEARKENRPFCFLLYPEGTLVSRDTRPVSKKFADKMGIVCSTFSRITKRKLSALGSPT